MCNEGCADGCGMQQLIKTLIQATTHMETLPRTSPRAPRPYRICLNIDVEIGRDGAAGRRYATFKLFYTAHTPADYEPVHFRAGDVERDRFFFATHGMDEPPEKSSIGRLETGHHGCVIPPPTFSVSVLFPISRDQFPRG